MKTSNRLFDLRKYFSAVMLFIFAVVPFSAVHSYNEIKGRVVNATQDSTGIANIDVHLQSFGRGHVVPKDIAQSKTGRNGFFDFAVQDRDSSSLVAAVDYNGIRYYSKVADAGTGIKDFNITVYDSTHDAGVVETMMHHVFIENLGETVKLRETRIMHNSGLFALTGAIRSPDFGEAALSFPLPVGAQNFAPLAPVFGNELIQHSGRVFDRGICVPGTRQVSYSYELPWRNSATSVQMKIVYPTRTLDFFIKEQNLFLTSSQLQDHGPFNIRGVSYHRYGIDDPQNGTEVKFTIHRVITDKKQSPFTTIVLTSSILAIGVLLFIGKSSKPRKRDDRRRKNR